MQSNPTGNPDLKKSGRGLVGAHLNSDQKISSIGTPIDYASLSNHQQLLQAAQAGSKLKIVALGPTEKGFLLGATGSTADRQFIRDLYDQWATGEKQAITWLSHKFRNSPEIKKNDKLDMKLNQNLMSITQQHLRHIQNRHFDYFEELQHEYFFYKEHEDGPLFQKSFYYLAFGGLDVSQNLQFDNQGVMVVFAINGIHALGIGYPDDEQHPDDRVKDVSIGIVKKRIRQLKGEEPLDNGITWEHRPLYITFCNHFNNSLCGHTRSLPEISQLLYNQLCNLDKGILKEEVTEIWRELLSLDQDLKSTSSKRILIDIRYMSAATRSEFYKKLVRKYNMNIDNLHKSIPIIASQAAYSGTDALDEMIKNAREGKKYDNLYKNGFLAWSINLTDEDVIEIHRSRGLIGITVDEYLLGGEYTSWINKLPFKTLQKKRALNLFKRTLEQFIRIPFDYNVPEPMRIWDILYINTSVNEVWQPLERYSSTQKISALREDLKSILESVRRTSPQFFGDYNTEDLVNKISFENERDFIIKNY
jgi:hypothetical protein